MNTVCYLISTIVTKETGVTYPKYLLECEKGKMPSIDQMTDLFKENGLNVVLDDLPKLFFLPADPSDNSLISIKITGRQIDHSKRQKVGSQNNG